MAKEKVTLEVTIGNKKVIVKTKTLTKAFNNKDNFGQTASFVISEPAKSDTKFPLGEYVIQGEKVPPDPTKTPTAVLTAIPTEASVGDRVLLSTQGSKDFDEMALGQESGTMVVINPVEDDFEFIVPPEADNQQLKFQLKVWVGDSGPGEFAFADATVRIGTVMPHDCPAGKHWDDELGQCVDDVPNPPGDTIDVSATWDDGTAEKLTNVGDKPSFDPNTELRAGAPGFADFDGKGNVTIKGDRKRLYHYYNNYNATLTCTLVPHFVTDSDDCSLKMRSRHNEPGKTCSGGSPLDGNRFGGYGFSIGRKTWDSKREPTHNCHDESKGGSLPKPLENDKPVILRQTVKDENGKVHQIGEIDYMDGQGFIKLMDRFDDNPEAWMVDKAKYEQRSYFWIRNNGSSSSITISNVKLERLP